jgi:hypothetical protein
MISQPLVGKEIKIISSEDHNLLILVDSIFINYTLKEKL